MKPCNIGKVYYYNEPKIKKKKQPPASYPSRKVHHDFLFI
jgi:hypothetical protein